MPNRIKTIYVVQHSHTDIGYTDLQETVIDAQVENLFSVLKQFRDPKYYKHYRWVCETLFVVDRFLDRAGKEEKEFFAKCVNENRIGLSLSYLNFNDGVNGRVLESRIHAVKLRLARIGVKNLRCAMCADINGISMGQRNALIRSGAEFLYMNVNATHGGPPFNRRHVPFWWECRNGQRILVWSAEHYNLGNALGLRHEGMWNGFFGLFVGDQYDKDTMTNLKNNIHTYLEKLEREGYPYSFLPVSVSGVFTDNAPHNPEIARNIFFYNQLPDREVRIRMVTLEELYDRILARKLRIPTFRGDMADWWADGIGCIPTANRLYRETLRDYRALSEYGRKYYLPITPELRKRAEENMLLFSEHTLGHSATVSHPYLPLVNDLDMHNQRYAVEAHAAVAEMKNFRVIRGHHWLRSLEQITSVTVIPPVYRKERPEIAHFEMEANPQVTQVEISDGVHKAFPAQCRPSPRGLDITFAYTNSGGNQIFVVRPCEKSLAADPDVRIYADGIANRYFQIDWAIGDGFRSVWDIEKKRELMHRFGPDRLFTPLYEKTPILHDPMTDRGLLGKNIRGQNFELYRGVITGSRVTFNGTVYTEVELTWRLESFRTCKELIRLYHTFPQVEVILQMCKGPTEEIESVYLDATLDLPGAEIWNRKGGEEVYRPGLDQLENTAGDYAATDDGLLYRCPDRVCYGLMMPDTPLVAFGPFTHRDNCDCMPGQTENNRPARAWIMNNVWETNFPISLAGFWSFRFSLFRFDGTDPETDYQTMADRLPDTCVIPNRFHRETEDIMPAVIKYKENK